MYKTGNSNAGWSLLIVSILTQPHPISQIHSSALPCFVSHKVLTMDGILIHCVFGFWFLVGTGKRLVVRREMKSHSIYFPSPFLLGFMFKDGYVTTPMLTLCSCIIGPLGNSAPFSYTFRIGVVTVIFSWYILAFQSVLLPLTTQLSFLFCTWSGH